ncbi:hypothetical protein Tsubulata_018405 [Turnera subulata]|uniref:Pollen Ole e 1 allergen and extensin family protein n=1 Tax=Turnera subulata TaxID=218843 RepID=A0A9Q0JKI6_9ROSI|nr:hypothetical protein Tsubulata_018405 [Turnera subulata]
MASHALMSALLILAMCCSRIEPSTSTTQFVKGKVSCLDCNGQYDFSGIKVLVKCDKVQKMATTTTDSKGSFEVELPSSYPSTSMTPSSLNCLAMLLGGPSKLYASRTNMVSKIVKTHAGSSSSSSFTTSTPLAFSTRPPSGEARNDFGSSKTINFPLPAAWGLAPSSYYLPFFPIIGIP